MDGLLSFNLRFKYHKGGGIAFTQGSSGAMIMLPKSQIEVDGVSHVEDYDDLIPNEEVDVYIPEWLADDKGVIMIPDFYTPLKIMFYICCISVPFGIWKLIDIIIWIFNNISIGLK